MLCNIEDDFCLCKRQKSHGTETNRVLLLPITLVMQLCFKMIRKLQAPCL